MDKEQLEKFIRMQEDIKYIKDDISDIKKAFEKFDAKIDDYIKQADQKYAQKWVEKAWTTVMYIGFVGIAGAIGYAIIHSYQVLGKVL